MSKSDTPISEIVTDRARKQLGKPDFAGDTPINGLDTETADGDVFAIGVYYGESGEYRTDVRDEAIPGLEVLNFLTSKTMKDGINVWFNLNFDANVVLKALPRENLEDIRLHNSTSFEDKKGRSWDITYIPKKCLRISDENGNSYEHYDASQFTYTSLEGAAEDWLGRDGAKADDEIDVTKFGKATGVYQEGEQPDVNAYTADRLDEIRRYLRIDCKLTAEIFEEIVDTAENELDTPIPFGSPFSTGYVAADYVRNRVEYKPSYHSDEVQSAAWKTYHGGRFEIIKRGNVGEVAGPDINSAYPAVMADLPDPKTLGYKRFGRMGSPEPTLSDLQEADYGFVKARVSTDADRPVQPFAVPNPNEGSRVEYPAINDAEIWVLKDIFEYAEAEGFLVDYDLQEAVLAYETEDTKFPFDFFKDLYAKRKSLEAEGRDKPAKLLKIVMNSMYGKTCQTTVNLKGLTEAVESDSDIFEEIESDPISPDEIPDLFSPVTDHRGGAFLEYQTAGRLFNPFLASYITGMTRLKLFKGVVDNNLENDVIMLATDCLMFDKEAFEGTEIHRQAEAEADDYAEALGGWDYDYVGEGFVAGSGVYQVDRTDKDEVKHGLRGFKDFYSDSNDFDTLREAAEMYPAGIPVTTSRPVTMGDILHKGGKLSEIGRFKKTERTLSADIDTKRSWYQDNPDFADLLAGSEPSAPKIFDGDRMRFRQI